MVFSIFMGIALKFLLENSLEEMNIVRITSCSSLEVVGRSERLNITSTPKSCTFKGSV